MKSKIFRKKKKNSKNKNYKYEVIVYNTNSLLYVDKIYTNDFDYANTIIKDYNSKNCNLKAFIK